MWKWNESELDVSQDLATARLLNATITIILTYRYFRHTACRGAEGGGTRTEIRVIKRIDLMERI